MLSDLALLASPVAIIALGLPSLALAVLGCMRDAPGEWGRAALTVWTCLASVLVAGAAVSVLGGATALLLVAGAFVALVLGGPWGGVVAAIVAVTLTVTQFGQQTWPVHPAAMPVVAIAGTVAALVGLLRRW